MYSLSELYTTVGAITLVYMLSWFVFAVIRKRRDVVDSAWGLGFVVVAYCAFTLRNNESIFALITLLLVALWGLRLFLHISSRNRNKKEDYRYAQMGELGSVRFWIKTFFSIFIVQGILMIIISSPVLAIMATTHSVNTLVAYFGCAIWILGILTEATADYQLRAFLRSGAKGIMQSGLWRYSRHPNYFGEITSWWGAAIIAASFAEWWGIIGALTISYLILKVSGIPLLEKRYESNSEYQAYAKRTSKLFPLPIKRR